MKKTVSAAGLQIPMASSTGSKLLVDLEIDGPAGGDHRLLQIGLSIEAVPSGLPASAR
jgi:hypothetical protein